MTNSRVCEDWTLKLYKVSRINTKRGREEPDNELMRRQRNTILKLRENNRIPAKKKVIFLSKSCLRIWDYNQKMRTMLELNIFPKFYEQLLSHSSKNPSSKRENINQHYTRLKQAG